MTHNLAINCAPLGYQVLKLHKSGAGYFIKRNDVVKFALDLNGIHIDGGKLASGVLLAITVYGIQLPRTKYDFMGLRHPDGRVDDWSTGATVASEKAWLADACFEYEKQEREDAETRSYARRIGGGA